jgi:hypothetical protein
MSNRGTSAREVLIQLDLTPFSWMLTLQNHKLNRQRQDTPQPRHKFTAAYSLLSIRTVSVAAIVAAVVTRYCWWQQPRQRDSTQR